MLAAPNDSLVRPMKYVGRYAIFSPVARGGFASVHLARSFGAGGFARTVAIKRLHRQFAQDPDVAAMFLDEAHLVARIRHPNVIPTLDLVAADDELMIVMEYVEGVTLRHLLRHARKRNRTVPLGVVLRTMVGVLRGLHAAHEARNEKGEALHIIHRDVSPDNILIGTDGLVRLLDFGVARALGQYHDTQQGEMRGKLAYMTPEQVNDEDLTRRSDVFSAAIVLWEAMTNERLFAAKSISATAHQVLTREIPAPSTISETPKKLDGIVLQGLERDPMKRWPTAERFAAAIEAVGTLASEQSLAQYVKKAGAERLRERADQVRLIEAAIVDESQLEIPARASMTAAEIRAAVARPAPADKAPSKTAEATPSNKAEATPSNKAELARVPEAPPPLASAPASEPVAAEVGPMRGERRSEDPTVSPLDEGPPLHTTRLTARQAILPALAVVLVAVIGLLLLREDNASQLTAEGASATMPSAIVGTPGAPTPAVSTSVAVAEPPTSAVARPRPIPRPAVQPRPPTPKPPPLYGRE